MGLFSAEIFWSSYWVFRGSEVFAHLADYTRLLEEQIDRMTAEEFQGPPRGAPRDEEDGEWQWRYRLFEEALPRNFRYSGVILLVTHLEATLVEVCHEVKNTRNLQRAFSDLDRRIPVAKRALKYLKDADVRLPKSRFRSTLHDLVTVRNCIAHGAGNVNLMTDPSLEKVRAAVKRLDGFNLWEDDYVEIEKGVCTRLVDEAGTWLDEMAREPFPGPM